MIDSFNYSLAISNSQSKLVAALQALSSGNSINSAADNPAGIAQASSYSVQLSSTAQSMRNIQDSISLLDTAGGATGQINQGLQDIRELTVQAGDGSLNAGDLQSIQSQIGQITQGINQIASTTQFNGQNLLDGSASLTVQAGADASQTQNIQLGNFSSSALGISGLDVTTSAGQTAALASLDSAIQQVSDQNANIGAVQSSLDAALSNQGSTYINIAAAKSQVSDTDYAQMSSNFAQAKVRQQASLQALALYNSTQKSILTLLPK